MFNFRSGRKTIGNSGVPLAPSGNVQNGVMLYSPSSNEGYVWVGTSGVTANTNDVTDGFPIPSGESFYYPKQPEQIFVRTDGYSGVIWWVSQ